MIILLCSYNHLKLFKKYKAKETESIEEHSMKLIENAKILIENEYVNDSEYSLLEEACIYHDFGKANDRFQYRIENNTKFNAKDEIPHNILSIVFVAYRRYLNNSELYNNKDTYSIIFDSVINHHRYVNNPVQLSERKEDILEEGVELIRKIYKENINVNILKSNIYGKLTETVQNLSKSHNKNYILNKKINGLLKKCDYSASSGLKIEHKNDFLINYLDELVKQFSNGWNDMQRYCKQNNEKNIVIVGSTGLGKTEASLLWAGNEKIFYVLPLKTAINSMYERIKSNLLQDTKINERLGLLHGDSLSSYLGQNEDSRFDEIVYYNKITRNLSLPLSISTPDQIFDLVYKYFGSEVKLSTMGYSRIIIDEIQSYSPDILCYVIYGLQKAVKFGAKFAIITATLPPFVKDLLSIGEKDSDLSSLMYYEEQKFINDIDRHNLKIIQKEMNSGRVQEVLNDLTNNENKKILVVCNTVGKAQKMYEELKEGLICEEIEIYLIHSKYIKLDRNEKENNILKDGKTEVKKNVIWISTQIVEASLDIDFDYLFTELSDLNSLFQRLGRVNRKGVKSVEDYNCYIYTEIDSRLLKSKDNQKMGFIDRGIH